jgi:hypothetical protein
MNVSPASKRRARNSGRIKSDAGVGTIVYTAKDIVSFIEATVRCDSEATFRGVRRELETKLGYQKRRMDEVKSDIDFLVQIVLRVPLPPKMTTL